MRILSTIFLLLIIAGCAKKGHNQTTSNTARSQAIDPLQLLAQTQYFDENALLDAASRLTATGAYLPGDLAQQCWTLEKSRPKVREACALAWAVGSEAMPWMEDELKRSALDASTRSRALSIASIKRRGLLSNFNIEEFAQVLEPLAQDPVWLRAIALREWLSAHAPSGIREAMRLWAILGWERREGSSSDPASLALSYSIAEELGLPKTEDFIASYCHPSLAGLSLLRCWRFLSVLAGPEAGKERNRIKLPHLPLRRDEGWLLFERTFPVRASLLKRFL